MDDWSWSSDIGSDRTIRSVFRPEEGRLSREPPPLSDVAEENARLRAVLGQCPKCIAVLDDEGRLVGCNREFSRVCGGAPPIGTHALELVPEPQRPLLAAVLDAAQRDERASALLSLALQDGSAHHVEFLAATLRSDHRAIGVILAGEDRTKSMVEDADRETLRQTVERANLEDTCSLAQASLQHDVANLITMGFLPLELLRSSRYRDRSLGDPQVQEALAECHRALSLAGEVLAEARSRSRREAIQAEPADVGACIRRVLRIHERSAPLVRSRIAIDDGLRAALSDVALAQIVLNLISNATYAIEAGRRTGTIDVCARRCAEDMVEIVVEDDGLGIEPSRLREIFEPYTTSRGDAGGTGLGLPIVRSIVIKAGGHVDVASVPNKGTRFVVTLPAA
jgi:PAS domain S-box-containing protein